MLVVALRCSLRVISEEYKRISLIIFSQYAASKYCNVRKWVQITQKSLQPLLRPGSCRCVRTAFYCVAVIFYFKKSLYLHLLCLPFYGLSPLVELWVWASSSFLFFIFQHLLYRWTKLLCTQLHYATVH